MSRPHFKVSMLARCSRGKIIIRRIFTACHSNRFTTTFRLMLKVRYATCHRNNFSGKSSMPPGISIRTLQIEWNYYNYNESYCEKELCNVSRHQSAGRRFNYPELHIVFDYCEIGNMLLMMKIQPISTDNSVKKEVASNE